MDELFYMRQLMSGSGQGWIQASLLVSLILVLCFRWEHVRRPGLFQAACWLFGLSLLVQPVLTLLLMAGSIGIGAPSRVRGLPPVWGLLGSFDSLLFGASVLCLLMALVPRGELPGHYRPARHPLE